MRRFVIPLIIASLATGCASSATEPGPKVPDDPQDRTPWQPTDTIVIYKP